MVVRRWGSAAALAVGVAAAAGAAQVGLAYGIGVIAWPPLPEATADEAWSASLAWACWVAATSTVAGAVLTDRLRARPAGDAAPVDDARLARLLWRLTLAVAGAVGALVTVILVAVPARESVVAGVSAPQAEAAGYALLGVLGGAVIAVAVLAARAAATNLIVTAAWLWLLAAASVTDHLVRGRDWDRVPLGFWDLDLDQPMFRSIQLVDAAICLGSALLVGVLAALPAARRHDHPAGVVVSGVTGPLVLSLAYLLAQPDLTTATATDLSRNVLVPYAVVTGLAGSLLASTFGTWRDRVPAGTPAQGPVVPAPRTPDTGTGTATGSGGSGGSTSDTGSGSTSDTGSGSTSGTGGGASDSDTGDGERAAAPRKRAKVRRSG
ncbi:MAG: hypothetical protein FWJ70_12415 [Micromonosporaceae bacterium]|jgi:uncharacterized membrane protein YgcG